MSKEYYIDLSGNDDLLGESDLRQPDTRRVVDSVTTDNTDLLGLDDDLLGESAVVAKPKKLFKTGSTRASQPPKRLCGRETKRGKVLACLLEHGSIQRVTDVVGLKRPAVLTYCFEIWRDHGVGYVVLGDEVKMKPHDGISPFKD